MIINSYLLLFICSLISPDYGIEGNTIGSIINVQDFGAIPNDGLDDTDALRSAAKQARDEPNSTLYFAPGQYHISDSNAIKIQEDALYGKLGKNPQDTLFRPNQEYVIGLDFKGAKNLVIEAKDVELVCDGWMEPLSFRGCKNITLNGITIDYKIRANSYGDIIKLGPNYVDVKFPISEPVSKDLIMLRIMIFDKESQSFVGHSGGFDRKEMISSQTIRFYGKRIRDQSKIGRVLIAFSGFHYRPAILIYKTIDIVLNDVTIHSQAGMGIVGHLSKNITMNRLKVVPTKGRYVSTNTDATHFASNRGLIRFNDCEFAGNGDDVTNVHTYYTHIMDSPEEDVCEIYLGKEIVTHSLYLDEPQVGDMLAVVEKSSLKEIGYLRVKRFWTFPQRQRVKIEFDGELPLDTDQYYLVNISASPKLEFVNSTVKSHRARSVLVKTRKVLIRDCYFENTTGTAIHIGAESNWGEGITSEDVVIENNEFKNCALGAPFDGTIDNASAIAIHVNAQNEDVPGLHKRILIQNNNITSGTHAISVKGAEDVTIRNNNFVDITEEPIIVGASIRVKAYANRGGIPINESLEYPLLPNLE